MRLLVTGGAGFVGSCFVRDVLRSQPDVRVTTLDALTYAGSTASLAPVTDESRHRFVHGDVCDAALVGELVADADAVVNFAAESHVDRSIAEPAPFLHANVVGAGTVFEACLRAGVERVLHVSTDEVYGHVEAPSAATEDGPLRPSSPYAASKAAADLLAQAYRRTHGYPILVTRASNTFGPFQHPEKLIARFVTRLLEGRRVPLYGDGEQLRDWLPVRDNAAAQWCVLTEGEAGTTYNLAAGNERSNRQVTAEILARLGAGDEMVERVADRPGHDRRYAMDTGRIRGLGWAPSTSFDEALDETVDWYRRHEDWWRPLSRADVSGPDVSGPDVSGPDVSGPDVSGPDAPVSAAGGAPR